MLETNHLRVLVALAEHRHFSRAAESLLVSQSAVSHQVRRIEEQVGARIIHQGRGVHFTPAGERLVTLARQVLALLADASATATGSPTSDPAVLRIGAPASMATYVLPEALREFLECFPHTAPVLKTCDTPAALEGLRGGQLDLAVILRPPAPMKEIGWTPLAADRLRAVVHPQHAWARQERIDRRSLTRQQFIIYDFDSITGRMIREHLHGQGVPADRCLEVGSIEAIKQLVRLGLGVTFLAPWVCAAETAAGSLVSLPVDRPRLERQWVVARRRDATVSFAERMLTGLFLAAGALRMDVDEE